MRYEVKSVKTQNKLFDSLYLIYYSGTFSYGIGTQKLHVNIFLTKRGEKKGPAIK